MQFKYFKYKMGKEKINENQNNRSKQKVFSNNIFQRMFLKNVPQEFSLPLDIGISPFCTIVIYLKAL